VERSEKDIIGVAFLCDMHGRLIRFLRDDMGLSEKLKPGQPFIMAFDTESVSKAFKFLIVWFIWIMATPDKAWMRL
jgi:hypothetical protein